VRLSEAVERRLPSPRKHHASRDAARPGLKSRPTVPRAAKQIADHQGWQWPGEVFKQVDATRLVHAYLITFEAPASFDTTIKDGFPEAGLNTLASLARIVSRYKPCGSAVSSEVSRRQAIRLRSSAFTVATTAALPTAVRRSVPGLVGSAPAVPQPRGLLPLRFEATAPAADSSSRRLSLWDAQAPSIPRSTAESGDTTMDLPTRGTAAAPEFHRVCAAGFGSRAALQCVAQGRRVFVHFPRRAKHARTMSASLSRSRHVAPNSVWNAR
jgi:hypothetical protein